MVETASIEMPLHVPTPSVKNAFVVPRRHDKRKIKKNDSAIYGQSEAEAILNCDFITKENCYYESRIYH